MRCSPLVLLLLPALAGCATVRSEYTPATGEKLSVYDKAIQRDGVQRTRAGEDEIRDATGHIIATNTRYQDKEIHWTEHDWYGVQGGVRIDDESFFRITGDDKATSTYKTYHEDGASTATIGGVVVGIGLGLVGAGIAGWVLDPPKTDPVTFHTTGGGFRTLGAVSMGVGGFTSVFALIALFSGRSKAGAIDKRLIDDPNRARADVKRYNDGLAPPEEAVAARSAAVAPPASPPVDGNQMAQQLGATTPADCRSYVVRGCDSAHGSRDERVAACDKLVGAARKAAATHAPSRACSALLHGLAR